MIRSVPSAGLADGSPHTEEDRYFWRALVDLAAPGKCLPRGPGRLVGVSQGYVSKILTGKQAPKTALRRRFAAFFKLEYEDMVALGRERTRGG